MLLQADSIAKSYGRQRVLTSASIRLEAGQVVGLVGRMGEGKSTLLKICAGILQPDAGWVRFAGVQYLRARLATVARRGLYYLEDSANLISALPLRLHFRAISRRYGADISYEVVDLLNLAPLLDVPCGALSGGELRRAELAVAISRGPQCILLDEPFRGVDPLAAELMGAAFQYLAAKECGVLFTGHEVGTFAPYAHKIVWLTSGTAYELGAPADAWRHDGFQRGYLGVVERSSVKASTGFDAAPGQRIDGSKQPAWRPLNNKRS